MTSKKVFSKEEWDQKCRQNKISKLDMNQLIMNYLVIEGYKDAAQQFSIESNIVPTVDLDSIQDRMNIRGAIQMGKIEEAIERVNDLDPEILDTNQKLYFHLQQQRLIELIRAGKVEDALEFAISELSHLGLENPEFLNELEQTMTLLAFDTNSPVSHLLDPLQRQKIASELNSAILAAQCQEKDPKLPSLLRMMVWAQNQLAEHAEFPMIKNLASAQFE